MNNLEFSIIKDINELQILRGRASFGYSYDENLMNLLIRYFTRDKSLYILVMSGGEFSGFCSVDTDWYEDNYFFLREILVEPKFQGHHIGAELIKRVIEHARGYNARGLVTETAFDNIPMRNLCEKTGFQEWDNPEWKEGVTYKIDFSK